jgi:hypothetical protein
MTNSQSQITNEQLKQIYRETTLDVVAVESGFVLT